MQRENKQIVVEIKDFRGKSVIADLEQAIGQYTIYRILLNRIDPAREINWVQFLFYHLEAR